MLHEELRQEPMAGALCHPPFSTAPDTAPGSLLPPTPCYMSEASGGQPEQPGQPFTPNEQAAIHAAGVQPSSLLTETLLVVDFSPAAQTTLFNNN